MRNEFLLSSWGNMQGYIIDNINNRSNPSLLQVINQVRVGNWEATGYIIGGPITDILLIGIGTLVSKIVSKVSGLIAKALGRLSKYLKNVGGKIGKLFKGVFSKGGRVTQKITLDKRKIKHIMNRHNFNKIKDEISHMIKKEGRNAVEKNIAGRSFFNKKWSESKIIKSIEKGANKLLKKGKLNGEFTVCVNGEKITIYMENGNVKSAWGHHKYNLKDFGY